MRLYRLLYWLYLLVVTLLVIDAVGFLAWAVSGQTPVDHFYAGVITKTIISLIF